MSKDSIHALWVDPLAFDAANGAPYLPEPSLVKTASADGESVLKALMLTMPQDSEAAELGVLVAILRAAAMVHQSHHWQTRGPSFYGDHLLFMRLYEESTGHIDQIAERAVGLGGESLVCPILQASLFSPLMQMWCRSEPTPAEEFGAISLGVEKCVLSCIDAARSSLSERPGGLSAGTDNLLQGVADKHEEFVYLLQQRSESAYSYDRST